MLTGLSIKCYVPFILMIDLWVIVVDDDEVDE